MVDFRFTDLHGIWHHLQQYVTNVNEATIGAVRGCECVCVKERREGERESEREREIEKRIGEKKMSEREGERKHKLDTESHVTLSYTLCEEERHTERKREKEKRERGEENEREKERGGGVCTYFRHSVRYCNIIATNGRGERQGR